MRQSVEQARAEAELYGSRRILWQILAFLAEIEDDAVAAQTLRDEAREIIEYIAAQTPEEFGRSFLKLPKVRAVME